ncbi:hypothetical protein AC579_5270 [Pseudocercospora musae]|uniref:Uncharacterized protein n=1 Tax=Pseudocercospora musae TaxID=113226 RepID=A0A139IPL4_9PEZI|nr:hypothetical protein AC579_5270 [Pseudocercospora musae]
MFRDEQDLAKQYGKGTGAVSGLKQFRKLPKEATDWQRALSALWTKKSNMRFSRNTAACAKFTASSCVMGGMLWRFVASRGKLW